MNGEKLAFDTYIVDRGGQTTYHGPGQIVLYPIMDLNYFEKDIHLYLRKLEEIIISTLQCVAISANPVSGLTGVWVGNDKIAAIGIKLKRWVSMHGLSLNYNPDMRYFQNIIPCGIRDRGVCSVVDYNPTVSIEEVSNILLEKFTASFGVTILDIKTGDDAIAYLESLPPLPDDNIINMSS